MKKKLYAGTTSHIERVFLQDTTQTDGRGLTGLAYNSAGLTVYYIRQGEASATAISLVTATVGTWVSGGFKEIDATNMPGWYELHVPNAAIAAGAKSVGIHLKGATNMAPYPIELELDALNYQDAVRAGLTALPNANAGASGGLPLGDASGRVDLGSWLGSAPDALSSGKVPADLKLWLATAPLALTAQRVAALVGAYDAGLAPLTESETQDAAGLGAAAAITAADLANGTDVEQILEEIAGVPAAALDLAAGVETGVTLRQALRIILAASAGKLSGAATTTITIRNVGDTKDRITATVDADGNRSAVVLDAS